MIILEPYVHDKDIYLDFPDDLKWVFNKLRVAELLGYYVGPSGTNTNVGRYVIRPIMNVTGMGVGGVYSYTTPALPSGLPANNHISGWDYPGYFWCEEFHGTHAFTEYVNDVPVRGTEGTPDGNVTHFTEVFTFPPLPTFLQGISRYALAEWIGGNLIEYSPRHISSCASQGSIDDYHTIDPTYNPTHVQFGFVDLRKIPYGEGGWMWEEVEESRQPWA